MREGSITSLCIFHILWYYFARKIADSCFKTKKFGAKGCIFGVNDIFAVKIGRKMKIPAQHSVSSVQQTIMQQTMMQQTTIQQTTIQQIPAFMRQMVRRSYESVLSVLAPRHCVICSQSLPSEHWSGFICQACFDGFSPAPPTERIMAEYRMQFPQENFRGELPLGSIFARFSVAQSVEEEGMSALRHVIYLLKYHHLPSLGIELGEVLGLWFMAQKPHQAYDVVVPVPLHAARIRERGYNQAEMLCTGIQRAMAHSSTISLATTMIRRKNYTLSQTFLNAKERANNLQNVIALGKEQAQVRGKRILLVDDVCTTGTTLHYCAQVLKEAGAVQVDALALAKA